MDERDLAYYLKGFFELKGDCKITRAQQAKILEKIKLVQKTNGTSYFAQHLEAVIDTPSSILKIVDSYFVEPPKLKSDNQLKHAFIKVQNDFAALTKNLFS